MYLSISGTSSHAFTLAWKPAHGSGEVMVGVSAGSGSRVVDVAVEGADSGSASDAGSGGGDGSSGSASGNTRVGLGALPSHGKIGFGFGCLAGLAGTWYHISLGASGYDFGAWNRLVSLVKSYCVDGKLDASGLECSGGGALKRCQLSSTRAYKAPTWPVPNRRREPRISVAPRSA